MSWSTWLALVVACSLISLTPGAGAVNTMSNAIAVGHLRVLWGILGLQIALVLQLVVVALGLGVVIAGSPIAFAVIRYTGAAYLIYLGVRQILRAPTPVEPETPSSAAGSDAAGSDAAGSATAGSGATVSSRAESAGSMLIRGLWVNLLNPKAIVFLLAFIPGFVDPAHGLIGQYLVIGLTLVAVDTTVMWLFFALVGRAFARLSHTEGGQRRINLIFGVLFIGVGILLATL